MSANVKPDRAPSLIWGLRKDIEAGYVETASDDFIRIVVPLHSLLMHPPDGAASIELTRKDARLLARRLHECLDDTSTTSQSRRRH